MLPGFRFLLAAVLLSISILIFGLGAAALLRAAHEEFAANPTWRGAPEPVFAQQGEATKPTLALLRVEPAPAGPKSAEPKPAATATVQAPAETAPLTDKVSAAENAAPAEKADVRQDAIAAAAAPQIAAAAETAAADVTATRVATTEPAATAASEVTATTNETAPAPASDITPAATAEAPARTETVAIAASAEPPPAPAPAAPPQTADPSQAAKKVAARSEPIVKPDDEETKAADAKAEQRARLRAQRARERKRLAAQRARAALQTAAASQLIQPATDLFGQQPIVTPTPTVAPKRTR